MTKKSSKVLPKGLHAKALRAERDTIITSLFDDGYTMAELSWIFNMTIQVIYAIIKKEKKQ